MIPVITPAALSPRRLGELTFVLEHVRRYPRQLIIASSALFATSAATIGIPYGFKRVIDQSFVEGRASEIASAFHYLLMIVVVLAIATAVRFYYVSWLGERIVADIRARVQVHLLRLAPRFFEQNRPSEIASRLTSDTVLIENVIGSTVSVALRNIFTGVGGMIYLLTLSPKLAGMLLLGIPLVMLPASLLDRRIRYLSRSAQDRVAEIGSLVTETFSAMNIVQAFGQEHRERNRFVTTAEAAFSTAKVYITLQAVMTATMIFLILGSITTVLWVATADLAAGRISGGAIAAFVLTGGIVAGAFTALIDVYGELLRGAGAASRLAELLRERVEIARPQVTIPLPAPVQGVLAFNNVRFHYPTRPDVAALTDFTLTVRPGETVALVGASGAGKSTVFELAERFYDPTTGKVMLDGIDLRDLDPAAIRAEIAIVPQDAVIFRGSARDNLRYGNWAATDDELWAAAEAANAADFLHALPQRLDTDLGGGGGRLSGGQRQRLTIARALLRNAPILLLDEATSALDAESERLVQQALERLMANRTTLVIAHRLSTVRTANRIIVMEHGRITEEGTHDMLVRRGGDYTRLAGLQFGKT